MGRVQSDLTPLPSQPPATASAALWDPHIPQHPPSPHGGHGATCDTEAPQHQESRGAGRAGVSLLQHMLRCTGLQVMQRSAPESGPAVFAQELVSVSTHSVQALPNVTQSVPFPGCTQCLCSGLFFQQVCGGFSCSFSLFHQWKINPWRLCSSKFITRAALLCLQLLRAVCCSGEL